MPHTDSRNALFHLLAHSWAEYDRVKTQDYFVRPAIPIAFFGDSTRYLNSSLRVLTVALNPSPREIPDPEHLPHFPVEIDAAATAPGQFCYAARLAALDSYFRREPCRRFFSTIEPILNGLGASFYDGAKNTALHTDLCSPVSTFSAWPEFSRQQRSYLESQGIRHWHSLIHALAPDIILASVSRRYFTQTTFHSLGESTTLWRHHHHPAYELTATPIEVRPHTPTLFVFGRVVDAPFGPFPPETKRDMGAAIESHYHAVAHPAEMCAMR